MKAIVLSALPLAFLASCTQNSTAPQQQVPQLPPQGQTATANPYGVPGQSDVGQYTPAPGTTPYQPVQPINPPALPQTPQTPPGLNSPNYPSPTIPSTSPPVRVAPGVIGNTHSVVKGDSLWGLSRKYGVSADAIRQANGMAAGDSTIRTGSTLNIPGR